ncbi:MAG TPA: hypothetical protein V6D47_05050 [Oscillatoriaceae cyanobacterium]
MERPPVNVAILDDYEAYAELLAGPLLRAGHGVMIELAPIDFERLVQFGPNVVSIGLYRRRDAYDRPIESVEKDIVGYQPLIDMECYPAINVLPLVLIGTGLVEKDVPTTLNYDLFLTFPEDLEMYLPKVVELATKVKTRRRISGYVCPVCRSRLVYFQRQEDLFCPRCGTAVAIVDESNCLYSPHGETGRTCNCTIAEITPPVPNSAWFRKEKPAIPPGGELYPGKKPD